MTVYISPNPGKEQAAETARRAAQLLLMQEAVVQMCIRDRLYAEAASLMEYCHAALEKASLQMEEIDAARSEKADPETEE